MKRKFKQLLKEEKELRDQQSVIIQRLVEVMDEIRATCEHENMVQRSSYSYGGYDYQGEDRTWDECLHCGMKSNLKIRYTGFG